jgi:hypothetical protein
MTTGRIPLHVALAAAAMALLPSILQADVIAYPVDFTGMGLHDTMRVTYSPAGLSNDTVNAGQILVEYRGNDYAAYCVDIYQHTGDGSMNEESPLALPHGDLAAWLFETYAADVTNGSEAAALQAAMWEVLFENPLNGYDIDHGAFRVNAGAAVEDAAQAMLNAMPDSYVPLDTTIVLHSPCKQDLMISSQYNQPVPEPGALAVLAIGGAATIFRRRRPSRRP